MMRDNAELLKFYVSLRQEIMSAQLTDEEGGMQEQIFVKYATDLLGDAGETENVRIVYDEKLTKSGVQHKINAYSIADNYETIDIFICLYNGTEKIVTALKAEVDKAAKRASNFFKNAVYGDYVKQIEESAEVFQFTQALSVSEEIKETLARVNVFILTDAVFAGNNPPGQTISGFPLFFKVIDINYLYNISEKSDIPIEINFKAEGFPIPCIQSPSYNDEYQTYLAIISGDALVSIYERFGSRLLEQNVRSFLQFTGKVNGGIRKTIIHEPHMFLAFNNGIAATADNVEVELSDSGNGMFITKVNDLQIVNGGQTTASIYHTWRKDKKNVSGVQVQLKLSVVKNKEKFSDIVSLISEYANTQNKITIADLSSNRPFHIALEKLSRDIWAPSIDDGEGQTRWFYERARGQYKNARLKDGFTPAKQKAFDLKNPRTQVFTKEDLAKYVNAFAEKIDVKKVLIGPHYVVRGSQKNYVQFVNHNLPQELDGIYYEDVIAKQIFFKAAERKYGVKPHSIGDMRYITVPYAIAYLNSRIRPAIDLYKIWKRQSISAAMSDLLYGLMVEIEEFIKSNAPGSLYSEWAKKEDCWIAVRSQDFDIDIESIKDDLEVSGGGTARKKSSSQHSDKAAAEVKAAIERIEAVTTPGWSNIEDWGRTSGLLSVQQQNVAWNLASKVRSGSEISEYERNAGNRIIDFVIEKAPEVLQDSGDVVAQVESETTNAIDLKLVERIIQWDKKYKRLKDHHFKYMQDLADSKVSLTGSAVEQVYKIVEQIKKHGFS